MTNKSTDLLFREDPYRKEAPATVQEIVENDYIVLDSCLFYPASGGQPGDSGLLNIKGNKILISSTKKGENGQVLLVPEDSISLPDEGTECLQVIDWEKRYQYMKIHTALHLLSVVIPLPVTGGQITEDKGRLDFNMPNIVTEKQGLEDRLNELIRANYAVTESWISEDELKKKPELIKTMSVSPPSGTGSIRLVRIGTDITQIDLQPCGGTHVKEIGEIGLIRIGKIEKKGKQNRRINIFLES